MSQASLFDAGPADALWRNGQEVSRAAGRLVDVNAREQEVVDALRFLVAASDCHDIRRTLLGFGFDRPTNCIGRRLTSLERKGLVRKCGTKVGAAGKPTTLWRLL
jgi:hypothetical protein